MEKCQSLMLILGKAKNNWGLKGRPEAPGWSFVGFSYIWQIFKLRVYNLGNV